MKSAVIGKESMIERETMMTGANSNGRDILMTKSVSTRTKGSEGMKKRSDGMKKESGGRIMMKVTIIEEVARGKV